LQNLVSLDLWNNSLRSLPEGILKLQNLRSLYAGGNLIENPPLEILDIKETWDSANLLKLHAYFRQRAEQGTDKIYEAKLIIVGEGGAGKTSLARRILDPKTPLPGPKESTEGIDVLRWDFRSEGGEKFRVNIWDFGGQEIYHATHQFFLSKRSLYVLVADTRRDDTDFYYWLNVVELLSDQSPVLIVKNEKNDRLVELGKSALRERFTSLKDSYSANVATCRGLDDIKDAMCHYLTHLPHVGSSLPKTWVKV
ncbi:MAG: GTPase, partial [Gammaproteobacteria bacterium]|nr:GTPase [Gammaproteobacteria bacterium]